jgi:hypothetical protein
MSSVIAQAKKLKEYLGIQAVGSGFTITSKLFACVSKGFVTS